MPLLTFSKRNGKIMTEGRSCYAVTKEVAEFVIYIINEIADLYNQSTSKVYCVLENTGCINDYLVPFYDVLHTMSSGSVAEDVIEYIKARGASI